MLATVLKTSVASKVSVEIMRAFVLMKKYISKDLLEQRYFKNMPLSHDEDLKLIHKTLEQLESKKLTNEIYYEGQIYDAYSKLIDIMNMASKGLIIIDRYADKSVLDMISKIDKKVILITKEKGLLKSIDLKKYNKQYHNLTILYNNTFHDRYLILDEKEVYHLGASLNHAGSKTFGVNKLEDKVMISAFINYVLEVIKSKKK